MNAKVQQLVLAVVSLVVIVGIVVLLAMRIAVPSELYAFAGLLLGGHLTLLQPSSPSTSPAAVPPASAP